MQTLTAGKCFAWEALAVVRARALVHPEGLTDQSEPLSTLMSGPKPKSFN